MTDLPEPETDVKNAAPPLQSQRFEQKISDDAALKFFVHF